METLWTAMSFASLTLLAWAYWCVVGRLGRGLEEGGSVLGPSRAPTVREAGGGQYQWGSGVGSRGRQPSLWALKELTDFQRK